ncbi:TPA: sigma-70 family RNA polymerase sigma factor [Enterococcus faecium]|nr:sigma-70 family RNA polymerase sigma factor [Enterococcus faecium]HAZ4686877.1 sigma-70 family RNA polymerase sigma factor [Enterococcus faecium]HAZ4689624.1 sigma-70 family RNA polymerase sigma factor [Enterococcus faecium]
MWKGGEIMNTSSFEHIVRIQFNALMITIIKCTVKSKKRQFSRRSKREILFCELSDMKNIECQTEDNYSCDYISFEVLNFTLQISNEKLAVALYKLSNKERDVILLHYFQSMSDQEIAELYHVSRSAIYRRRSNGLKKLKALLKERN